MAFVLPPPSSPQFDLPFGNHICSRSCSSNSDIGTIRRLVVRNASPTSFAGVFPSVFHATNCSKENNPLSGSTSSLINFRLYDGIPVYTSPRRSWSWDVTRDGLGLDLSSRNSLHGDIKTATQHLHYLAEESPKHNSFEDLTEIGHFGSINNVNEEEEEEEREDIISSTLPESPTPDSSIRPSTIFPDFDGVGCANIRDEKNDQVYEDGRSSPLKRWLRTLRKRQVAQPEMLRSPHERWIMDDFDPVPLLIPSRLGRGELGHRKTLSSASSSALLSAVKTASVTLSSLSRYPRSRQSGRNSCIRLNNSPAGENYGRDSLENVLDNTPAIDAGIWYRSIQRNRIFEEIITSEESYIRDLKTFLNVYLTVLPRKNNDRKTIHRSVTEILQLHEELLTHLHTLRDNHDNHPEKLQRHHRTISQHIRWRSLETTPPKSFFTSRKGRWARHSIDTSRPSLILPKPSMADTKLVMNTAKMQRFLKYEAYAACKDLMGETNSTIKANGWKETEKGIEALSVLTLPFENHIADNKKALTFSDLVIKPIQRICKYPLFFNDLCRHTPACDDPVAHEELEKVLSRLQRVAEEIDQAMSNPDTRKRIDATWLLQERLEFESKAFDKLAIIPKLGNVLLCGVLHVAYATDGGIKGQYMICSLYRGYLVISLPNKASNTYQVFTVIPLITTTIEAADNGRGLQCHTAQFTWKLIFDIDRRQQELLISACSEMEETCWKNYIRARITVETLESSEGRENSECLSQSNPTIKSISPTFGPFTNFSRRLSVQRAATLGPKSNLQQVIIKNTEAPKYVNSSSTSFSVTRSQSHMSSAHIPTLAPRRQDRVKLEIAVADVWTKSVLPYPGMSSKRIENPLRASANHVMRKLSIASIASMTSIASSFSKRSVSHATVSGQWSTPLTIATDDTHTSSSSQSIRTLRAKKATDPQKPVIIDFHNTPKAFLPEDFELDIKPRRRAKKINARLSMMLTGTEDLESSTPSCSTTSEKPRNENIIIQQQSRIPQVRNESEDAGITVFSFGSDGAEENNTTNDNIVSQHAIKETAKIFRNENKSTISTESGLHKRSAKTTKRFFVSSFRRQVVKAVFHSSR